MWFCVEFRVDLLFVDVCFVVVYVDVTFGFDVVFSVEFLCESDFFKCNL